MEWIIATTVFLTILLYLKISQLQKQLTNQTPLSDIIHTEARLSREELQGTLALLQDRLDSNRREITETLDKNLGAIKNTVDEKLQTTLEKRLGESFRQINSRLEAVHIGLGEMKSITTGVDELRKVLSNVKTRGTLGEYQLGAILEQILAPEQYSKDVQTKRGSRANVEYAIKLPGNESEVWIPVDSKFPLADYNRLMTAFENNDLEEVKTSQANLLKSVVSFAKDISLKYLDPPHTTNFGIMFLPIEGLYAELMRHPSLFHTLQEKHKITMVGPSTLAAFISSLRMGFSTLEISKHSSDVWEILRGVKSEFETFETTFTKVQKQLGTAADTLENLRTTRTNVMGKKLRSLD